MTLLEIVRPIGFEGIDRLQGEVIEVPETTTDRRVRNLVSGRRVKEVEYDAPTPVECKCGRLWSDARTKAAHMRIDGCKAQTAAPTSPAA